MFLKNKIIFFLSIAILISVALFFYKNKNSSVKIGGEFELNNHLGETVNNKNFKGRYLLVFFGFTNCPDFCPNTLNDISTVLEQLDSKSNNIVPLFITVDPDRDTVSVLKNYLRNFHPQIIGLTGTKEQIDLVKKNYKIFSKKVKDIKEMDHANHGHDHGGYGVDHTTILYLMDKKGRYLTHFSGETSSSVMLEKINQYIH